MINLNRKNWTSRDYERFVKFLESEAESEYQQFSSALVPDSSVMLGIRIPKLRLLAKQISLGNSIEFLECCDDRYFECTMIAGFVIAVMKCDFGDTLREIEKFSTRITNWSVCDSVCASLKCFRKSREQGLVFLRKFYEGSDFQKRFATVMLLDHYMASDYLHEIFYVSQNVQGGYYVKMAVAWILSVCYVHFPIETNEFFDSCTLDKLTFNKAIQKCCESRRINDVDKSKLILLKKH